MTIETKFNKEDSVFVIFDNKVINTTVKSINISVFFNEPNIEYKVDINGHSYMYKEQHVFATKEELIKSL